MQIDAFHVLIAMVMVTVTMGSRTVSMRVRMNGLRWSGRKGRVDRRTGRRACVMEVEMMIVCLDSTQWMAVFRRGVVMVTMRMIVVRVVMVRVVVVSMAVI